VKQGSKNEEQLKLEIRSMTGKAYDLEERLIDFAVLVINLVEDLPGT
jgi:hypothetical protein